MERNSLDYFTYKKNKMHRETKQKSKSTLRFNILLQLFITTFIVIFIIIVITIMKYSAKMDIEYSKGDLSFNNIDSSSSISGYNTIDSDDEQRNIDKRLMIIQQEENAPSEAKIIENDKNKKDVIIAAEHIENSKKIDKIEKIKAHNEKSEQNEKIEKPEKSEKTEKSEAGTSKITEMIGEVRQLKTKVQEAKNIEVEENVKISSKVLIGRYSNFEQASAMQAQIKSKNPSLSPFVRKVGEIYSVQMGSFQDFAVAKSSAQKLKALGYEVWIYQQ